MVEVIVLQILILELLIVMVEVFSIPFLELLTQEEVVVVKLLLVQMDNLMVLVEVVS